MSREAEAARTTANQAANACTLADELSPTFYHDRKGRSKAVRYWLMDVQDGEFEPNEEVDELRWLTPKKAAKILTYPRDAELASEVAS